MRNFQYLLYLPKHRFLFKYCYIKDGWYQLRHNNNSMLGKIIFASLLATCIFFCAHAVPISVSNWNNIFFLCKSCIIYQNNFTKLKKGYSFYCPSCFIYFLNWRKHKLKLEYLENKPCAMVIYWKEFYFSGKWFEVNARGSDRGRASFTSTRRSNGSRGTDSKCVYTLSFQVCGFFLMKIYLSVFIWKFKNINPIFKRIFKSF